MNDSDEHVAGAIAAMDSVRGIMASRRPDKLTRKSDRDFATDIDYEIEQRVRDHLLHATPDIGFLGEEQGSSGLAEGQAFWAFDPVDGTSNFAHGLPLCGSSLGLIVDGMPVLGIVDLPFLAERFTATRGGGAFLNGERIHASTTGHLDDAVIGTGDYAVGPDAATKNITRFAVAAALAARVERVRMFGSAAIDLTWTAAGRLDGSVMLSNKPWDVAAGIIIAREAGAQVSDIDGNDHNLHSHATIATSPGITSELHDLLHHATNTQ